MSQKIPFASTSPPPPPPAKTGHTDPKNDASDSVDARQVPASGHPSKKHPNSRTNPGENFARRRMSSPAGEINQDVSFVRSTLARQTQFSELALVNVVNKVGLFAAYE